MKLKNSVKERIQRLYKIQRRYRIQAAQVLRPSTQKISFRRDDSNVELMISRSYVRLASTIFLILSSLLPYFDIFLKLFWDIDNIPTQRFANFSTALWTYSICISPLLILLASKLKPYNFAYIVPIYVYVTMFCGFIFLEFNVNISSDWLFRLITMILSFILIFIGKVIVNFCKMVRIKEEVLNELIKNKDDAKRNTNL